MRPWIKISLGILALALVAILVLAATAPDNRLAWIRKYNGREKALDPYTFGPDTSSSIIFNFDQIPPDLIAEIKRRGELKMTTLHPATQLFQLPQGQKVRTWPEFNQVTVVTRRAEPSWLQRKWKSLMRRLGAR